jgi:threonine dehydrogenase-like Zn-dependent dehydrogenase
MDSKTVVLTEEGVLAHRTIDVPEPGPTDVLLRIELSGVCGSDVHMKQHGLDLDYPVVPGHELVGVVEEVGDEVTVDSARRPIDVGDAITVVPGISCDDCWYCDNMPTRPLTCNNRDVHGFRGVEDSPHIHGGMSQYMLLEDRAHYYKVPDDLETDLGALVEPVSVAGHAIERAYPPGVPHAREGLGPGQSVVVQGAGPIGLLTMGMATAVGAGQVIAVDMIEERLEMAEQFGATDTVDLDEFDGDEFIDEIAALTPSGDGPDLTVEAVGHPSAFEQALEIPHNGGTVVEVGHYFPAGDAAVNPSDLIHRQLDVYGSLAYPPGQFDTAISVLERTEGRFPYTDLMNHQVGIDDVDDAFEKQASGDAYRATVHPWE